MKWFKCCLFLVFAVSGLSCQQNEQNAQSEQRLVPVTDAEKKAYSRGYILARPLRAKVGKYSAADEDFSVEMFLLGISDAYHGRLQLDKSEANAIAVKYEREIVPAKLKALQEKWATENRERAKQYLDENRDKPGIVETESGLQYQILQQGEGKQPAATDHVTLHYRGSTIDGKVFDETYESKWPLRYNLATAMPGWQEGLQLMKEGARFKLFVPPDLVFGKKIWPHIPKDTALIYEMELVEVFSMDKE